MARISFSQPSLLGGVSQQPDALRLPNQCEEQINFIPSPVDGLYRRYGMQYVASLDPGFPANTGAARVFPIIRDNDEQYVLIAQNNALRVFGLDGTEYGVYADEGLTPADFSYLPADPSQLKVLNVADYTFILNRERIPTKDLSVIDSGDTVSGHAYVSVIQGQYSTDYSVSLDPLSGGAAPETFTVSTWDGVDQGQPRFNKIRVAFRVSQVGTAGDTWALTYQDYEDVTQNLSYVMQAGDGAKKVGQAFRDLFAADEDLTVSSLRESSGGHWYYFSVETTDSEHQAPGTGLWELEITSTPPAGATDAKITTNTEAGILELASIKTDDIAQKLAELINESVAGIYTAAAVDHVIQIQCGSPFDISVDDTGNDDLMHVCSRQVEAIDELPSRCVDGYSVKVRGEAKGTEDDYWVTFRREDLFGVQFEGMGEGRWEEGRPLYPQFTVQPGDPYYSRAFLADNMPWSLVRRFDLGGNVYFTFEKPDWVYREVGDTESNPFPSFVGKPIDDIIFWRNRLGLVAGASVTFSEAGSYFNFWRTSVRQLLDSDPVDVQSNLRGVIEFSHAVEVDGDLLLTSDAVQVRLEAEPVLSPTTASMVSVLRLQVDTERGPEVVGRGVMIPFLRGSSAGIHEIYRSDEVNYDYQDITEQVPAYIQGRVLDISSSPMDGVAAVLTDSGLWLYNFFVRGREKLQSAWSRLDVGGEILGAAFFESDLYITVRDEVQVNLYKIPFESNYRDPVLGWDVRLDRKVSGLSTSYDAEEDTTTADLPYYCDPAEEADAWYAVTLDDGSILKAVPDFSNPSLPQVTLPGDLTGTEFVLGKTYESLYRFSRIMVRETTGERVQGITSGRTQLLQGKLLFRNTGYAHVSVDHGFSSVDEYAYWGPVLGSGGKLTDLPTVENDEFEFPIYGDAEIVRVSVSSSSCLPLSVVGSEWTVDFSQRSTRYRG